MLKFYTSHCQKCGMLKAVMDNKGIEYEEIDDENIYLPIVDNNNIKEMPFAEIDGKILTTNELREWIINQ